MSEYWGSAEQEFWEGPPCGGIPAWKLDSFTWRPRCAECGENRVGVRNLATAAGMVPELAICCEVAEDDNGAIL